MADCLEASSPEDETALAHKPRSRDVLVLNDLKRGVGEEVLYSPHPADRKQWVGKKVIPFNQNLVLIRVQNTNMSVFFMHSMDSLPYCETHFLATWDSETGSARFAGEGGADSDSGDDENWIHRDENFASLLHIFRSFDNSSIHEAIASWQRPYGGGRMGGTGAWEFPLMLRDELLIVPCWVNFFDKEQVVFSTRKDKALRVAEDEVQFYAPKEGPELWRVNFSAKMGGARIEVFRDRRVVIRGVKLKREVAQFYWDDSTSLKVKTDTDYMVWVAQACFQMHFSDIGKAMEHKYGWTTYANKHHARKGLADAVNTLVEDCRTHFWTGKQTLLVRQACNALIQHLQFTGETLYLDGDVWTATDRALFVNETMYSSKACREVVRDPFNLLLLQAWCNLASQEECRAKFARRAGTTPIGLRKQLEAALAGEDGAERALELLQEHEPNLHPDVVARNAVFLSQFRKEETVI